MNIFGMELASITISGRLKHTHQQTTIVERIFAKPITSRHFWKFEKQRKRITGWWEGAKQEHSDRAKNNAMTI